MMDADYADDSTLLVNTPTLAEFQQHSLEQAAGSVGLNVNLNKTEYICFKWEGAISIINGIIWN